MTWSASSKQGTNGLMGFLKTMGYREFHVSVSRRSSFLPLFSRELSLYFYYHLYLLSFLLFSLSFFSFLLCYLISFQLSAFAISSSCHVRAHTSIFMNCRVPNRNLRPILCLFSEVPIVRSRTVPCLTSIRLSGQSIPPIKLVEQADSRRSKFRQFAYIFRKLLKRSFFLD